MTAASLDLACALKMVRSPRALANDHLHQPVRLIEEEG